MSDPTVLQCRLSSLERTLEDFTRDNNDIVFSELSSEKKEEEYQLRTEIYIIGRMLGIVDADPQYLKGYQERANELKKYHESLQKEKVYFVNRYKNADITELTTAIVAVSAEVNRLQQIVDQLNGIDGI